ncbi:hypothetical protein F5Y09DRAFT_334456 [Xylaria sp. FL1042]|nr:hypothetical protein F5Y09DRAFT_334456 [Xylaria sp. FL1042]
MHNLVLTYIDLGWWVEAETLYIQVLEMRKKELGPEHPAALSSMHELAILWDKQGRDHDALELMEQCYQLRRWRTEESQASERQEKPRLKSAILSLRTRFRKATRHRDPKVE